MARVFVSHRGSDAAEAEQLADELRKAGHQVRLDVWDVNVGDSIIKYMNDGTAGANALVLCLSDNTSDAPWMDREWMSSLHRQLQGEAIRIYPVLLTGGSLPPIIADLQYADLTTDFQKGLDALLKALS
jgi:hypothetical protein